MLVDLDFQINKIKHLVTDSFIQINQLLLDGTVSNSNSNLLNSINKHTKTNHGKKLRPLLLLLSGNAIYNLQNNKINHQNHIKLAAAIELIHIASLLHDDVLDNSTIRRNQQTINAEFDNKCAILAGDFLYAKAFKLISNIDSQKNNQVTSLIANTSQLMVEGEILQLSEKYNFNIKQDTYLQIITYKTAKLFATTMQLPGILNLKTLTSAQLDWNFLAECGLNLGIAYQLLDDVIDYYKYGNDISEGRITLPVIFLLHNSDISTKKNIIQIINQYPNFDYAQQLEQIHLLKKIIFNNGGFDYTINLAKHHLILAKTAINVLFGSEYKQAIVQIIDSLLDFQLPNIEDQFKQ